MVWFHSIHFVIALIYMSSCGVHTRNLCSHLFDECFLPTLPVGVSGTDHLPTVCQTGFLLKRDDKFRWHRYWCRVDGKDTKFFVFSDSHEEGLIKSVPLVTVTTSFGSPQATADCDKENCFVLTGTADAGEESGSGVTEEVYLAAYSDVDYHQWRAAFSILTGTRDSMRMSSGSLLDSSHWGTLPPTHDTASISSSNFSSNRESVISTTSSLPYALRLPNHESPPRGRSPLEQVAGAGDTSTLSSKQMQPLPSPPPAVSIYVLRMHVHPLIQTLCMWWGVFTHKSSFCSAVCVCVCM